MRANHGCCQLCAQWRPRWPAIRPWTTSTFQWLGLLSIARLPSAFSWETILLQSPRTRWAVSRSANHGCVVDISIAICCPCSVMVCKPVVGLVPSALGWHSCDNSWSVTTSTFLLLLGVSELIIILILLVAFYSLRVWIIAIFSPWNSRQPSRHQQKPWLWSARLSLLGPGQEMLGFWWVLRRSEGKESAIMNPCLCCHLSDVLVSVFFPRMPQKGLLLSCTVVHTTPLVWTLLWTNGTLWRRSSR